MSKALQEFTRISRYSRYVPSKGRRETWEEQVDRVFDSMHGVKYNDIIDDINEEYKFAKKTMLDKLVLGSQRALQFGGPAILNKHARIYNCVSTYIDRPRVFQETMWLLLCGCGCGFSVQKHHVAKLPDIAPIVGEQKLATFLVPDTIEGWGDTIGILMSCYFVKDQPFPEYFGKKVYFDFSQIRPKGSPIAHMGGTAPGYEPLKKAVIEIRKIFDACFANGQTRLRPIDAYDIIMHSSDAVLAGGVRRCIGKGSLVLTKEGSFKPIEKIQVGDHVSTHNGWKPVTNTFVQGEQKTLEIKHSNGNLICTPNHRVAVLSDMKGNFEWKEAGKLSLGDRLLYIEPDIEDGVNKLPDFEYERPLHSTTCKDITIPELDEEMAWLLGNIHGDGYIYLTSKQGQVSVAIEPDNMEQVEFVQDQLQRFGVNTRLSGPTPDDRCIKVRVKSKQLATYFQSWLKKPKTPLRIPECILNGTREIKFAYLQGAMDADGCVKGKSLQVICSIYPEWVKELQNLLYSLGIVSRFKASSTLNLQEGWKPKFTLIIIHNFDRVKFNEGCSLGWKKFPTNQGEKNCDSFPIELFDAMENKPIFWYKKFARNNGKISLGTWRKIEDGVFVPMEVMEIKDHKVVETFDIEVEGNHNFICEGVLVHNSATICVFSADDDEMISAKTGNWFIDNAQRGRSNNSALLIRNETKKEDFQKIMESVKSFGEPGFVWAESTEVIYNPCVPDDTWVMTSEGSKQVKDLIETPFIAIVDGKPHESKTGFIKTGKNKQIFKITTKEGFEVRATDNHKIMTADNEWMELKDLEVGDKINIHDHSEHEVKIDSESDEFAEGWILGSLYGDGTFYYPGKIAYICFWGETRHEMQEIANNYLEQLGLMSNRSSGGHECKNVDVGKIVIQNNALFRFAKDYIQRGKILTDQVEKESLEFQAGFLRGWFDADGSVQGNQNKGVSIRLTSTNLNSLKRAQRMSLRLGVYGRIYQERYPEGDRMLPDGNGGSKLFHCKATHELIITRSSMKIYQMRVGFHESQKNDKLALILSSYKRRPSGSKYVAEITEIAKDEVCDVYDCMVEDVHAFDANGVYVHNCVEISLYPVDKETGLTGWQFCNLCEINMKDVSSEADFLRACRAGAIIGTFQAGYTDFKYLGPITEKITRREALLGVSMTGIMDSPAIALNPEILRKGAEVVKATNRILAKKLGINPAARTTCVKPAGSTSCILGTASGIHPHHAKRYFRRVQVNKLEPPQKFFRKYNPDAIEESVWSANKTDDVVTFLCEVPKDAITKNDVNAIQLLEYVKLVQENWVKAGKEEKLCVEPWLEHNVSNTINVKPDEWDGVTDFIYENRQNFAGISLLPMSGELLYRQAPFQKVMFPDELIKEYGNGAMFMSGLIIHGLKAFDNDIFNACDAALDQGAPLDIPDFKDTDMEIESQIDGLKKLVDKRLFIERAKKFSRRYFGGDIQKMTYCLKNIDAFKKWCDLERTYVDVPWIEFKEKKDNVKLTQTVACAGGTCELVRM